MVAVARSVFDAHMPGPNQIHRTLEEVEVTAADLCCPPVGARTEAGLRHNVRVGVQYLESWLRGTGCVPLQHLMEDAATAEISRTQVWHWIRHRARLEDGAVVTAELFRRILHAELDALREAMGPQTFERGRFDDARALFDQLCTDDACREFLTLGAYDQLVASTGSLNGS